MTRTVFTTRIAVRSRCSTNVKYLHCKIRARICTRYVTTLERNELREMSEVYEMHDIRG